MRFTVILLLLFSYSVSMAQTQDDLLQQLDQIENELDSMLIFELIDELLSEDQSLSSEIYARFGYSGNVISAGRTYGIDQYGLSPGISFYHKKGWFADVSGFWNSETDPKYNLTTLSAGYMGFLGKRWNYSFDYEYWNYHESSSTEADVYPLRHSMGTALGTRFGPISTNIDYSFLFGDSKAHRIIGSVSYGLDIKSPWIFDRISLYPTAYVVIGNDEVTTLRVTDDPRVNRLLFIANLPGYQLDSLAQQYQDRPRILRKIRQAQRYDVIADRMTDEQYGQLLDRYYIEENEKVFGLLNYSFGLPVSLTKNRFSLLISYSYSIPVKLPNETYKIDPVGFFSTTLTYRISIK